MQPTPINHSRARGFTLIEMLVVAPLVLLLIGTIIGYITVLTGESLQVKEKNAMAFNLQDALDTIESDSVKATRFLATSGTLPSPQGKNDGTAAFTSSDSLVIGVVGTTQDPINPDREAVYYANRPNPCGANQRSNELFLLKVVYFVKDGSLWRRQIVPSWNTNSPADDFTVCAAPWQRNSCAPGQTAVLCQKNDEELLQHVSAFSVKYYPDAASSTELAASDAKKAKALTITLTTQNSVAGRTLTQTGSIKVVRLNDIDSDLVAPTQAPSVSYDFNNTTSVTFNWDTVPNATSYKVSYSVNGGGYVDPGPVMATTFTIPASRLDTVTFRVAARNGFGATTTTQTSAQMPSKAPCDLQNDWLNYGSIYGPATFTKTSAGVVVLSGLVKGGTANLICTLPPGYRPSARLIFPVTTTGNVQGRIDVQTNGDVLYQSGSKSWMSLDGVNFLADGAVTWTNLNGSNGWVPYGGSLYAPPQAAVDSTGRIFVQGLAKGGTVAMNTLAFTLPASITPPSNDNIYPVRSGTDASMRINADSTIFNRGNGTNGYWSLQAMFYPSTASMNNVTFQNGWVNYGGGYTWVQYKKNSDDIVSLRGLAKSGTATAGTVLFTLPPGYRPLDRIICLGVTNPDSPYRLDIGTDGDVILNGGAASGWLSIAGCDFLAEQ